MSRSEARERLGTRQAELVRALVESGPVPAGFDAWRLRASSESLDRKRMREVANVWPALVRALGESFATCFESFASRTPRPVHGGPLADGRAFVRTLQPSELTDEARLELLSVDLHHRTVSGGLVPRRWPVVKLARLPRTRRLVLGVWLPWVGARWWRIA